MYSMIVSSPRQAVALLLAGSFFVAPMQVAFAEEGVAAEASISSIQTLSDGSGATSQQTSGETDASMPSLMPEPRVYVRANK